MASVAEGYRALTSALYDWKWWQRMPGVVEAMALSGEQIVAVDRAMRLQALDAIEHWEEETGREDDFVDFVRNESAGFREFYHCYQQLIVPPQSGLHAESWSRKEEILQQIEDSFRYEKLWKDIDRHLGRPGNWTEQEKESYVAIMMNMISEGLNYIEYHRDEVEKDAEPK